MAEPGQVPELVVDGTVATITLRRPDLANRLEVEDLRVLVAHIAAVDALPDVRVLRLTGSGRFFCSGFNVGSIADGGSTAAVSFEDVADAIERARPVTIAAVNGSLYGGATDLALACDFRFGLRSAECLVPAARLGLHFYRSGMERMVTRLGVDTAKRVLLCCERMDGAALRDAGLFTHLLDDVDALRAAVDELTARLAAMAPLAMLPMKRHLNAMARQTLDVQALQADIVRAAASDDLREGTAAHREKRTPRFQGR